MRESSILPLKCPSLSHIMSGLLVAVARLPPLCVSAIMGGHACGWGTHRGNTVESPHM